LKFGLVLLALFNEKGSGFIVYLLPANLKGDALLIWSW